MIEAGSADYRLFDFLLTCLVGSTFVGFHPSTRRLSKIWRLFHVPVVLPHSRRTIPWSESVRRLPARSELVTAIIASNEIQCN